MFGAPVSSHQMHCDVFDCVVHFDGALTPSFAIQFHSKARLEGLTTVLKNSNQLLLLQFKKQQPEDCESHGQVVG